MTGVATASRFLWASLVALLCITGLAANIPAPAGQRADVFYTYDAPTQRLTPDAPGPGAAKRAVVANASLAGAEHRSVLMKSARTAAKAPSLPAGQLGPSQLSNLNRFVKKLPSGAGETKITRLPDGSVQFSADVPGRVPGSYATYTKVVDAGGKTIGYTKTTVAPDGSVVHVKDKLNP